MPQDSAGRIARIQEALREEGLAGWILYDFHGTNPIARSVLGVSGGPEAPKTTRRWFYLVPARGEPEKVVHRLEPRALDHLPGPARVYLAWPELDRALGEAVGRLLAGAGPGSARDVAMEYSPHARLPYVSRVDAGTVEMVTAAGVRVVSSADLAQRFGAVLAPPEREGHRRAGRIVHAIIQGAFAEAAERARGLSPPHTEVSLQRWIRERLAAEGLVSSDPPTVAVNAHSGDPHFTTTAAGDAPVGRGDFLLLDVWAKESTSGAVYSDYTQVAYLGPSAPERYAAVFAAVRDARDAAVVAVRTALREGHATRGCDVDDVARGVIRARGFGERFLHRTGHSIGEEVHGNGVHLDNLETHDDRRLLDGTLVSVEPGIYLDDFGVRSEVNLLIDGGRAEVTTEPVQRELPALLP